MKTIKQIVYDYLRTPTNDERFIHDGYYALEHAVRYGIEEAQKWISVDSELPPEDGLDYLLYNEKWKHADINPRGIRYGFYSSGMDDNWTHVHYSMYMDEYITAHDAPTHWRPIELK